MTTDESRRRLLRTAALAAPALAVAIRPPSDATPTEQLPLLDRLGRGLKGGKLFPEETLRELKESGLDTVELDPTAYQLLDSGAQRSVGKWIERRAGLTLEATTFAVFTRRWALVEYYVEPSKNVITKTRFVDCGPPACIGAMLDGPR